MIELEQSSSVRAETRVMSPYSSPVNRRELLRSSSLNLGSRAYSDEEVVVLEDSAVRYELDLNLRLEQVAFETLCKAWKLKKSDFTLVVIYEEKMLWDLELVEVPISKLSLSDGYFQTKISVPAGLIDSAKQDRVVVRAYLALNAENKKPKNGAPANKGAIVSDWEVSVTGPDELNWWNIQLLNEEALEYLNRNRKIKIYSKALVFVATEALLEPGDLSDKVQVYLNAEIAAQLQTSRASGAVEAVFNFIGAEVLASILAGLRNELGIMGEGSTVSEESAIYPFVQRVAESLGITEAEVIEIIPSDGEDLSALKSNLQRIVPVTDSIKKMLKGLSN